MGNTVAVEVANMLAAAWLMLSSLFYSLQLSSGSFPRPLTEEEERYYLDLAGKGDLEARNVLIERNLRLVAHIMKNCYSPQQPCVADGWGAPVCVLRPQCENLLECGAELKINVPGRRRLLAGVCLWVGDRKLGGCHLNI